MTSSSRNVLKGTRICCMIPAAVGMRSQVPQKNRDTAAKMTRFWAWFKQNDLQNRAIREILAKSYRIVPQNHAEVVPKLLLQIPLYVNFSILILLCSMIMSIHCFIGIFVGPLNTNCNKYQANQKWAKLELSLSCGKSTTLCILCHEKMRRFAVHTYHSTLMCSSQDYLVKTPIVNNRGGG